MAPVMLQGETTPGLRRGMRSAIAAVLLVSAGALPSRLSLALRGWGLVSARLLRAAAGVMLDLTAVIAPVVALVALVTLVLPLVLPPLRRAHWQRFGALYVGLPFSLLLWVATVTAQEVKGERGSFPTVFDLAEAGSNSALVGSSLGFIFYQRIWLPALAGVLLGVIAFLVARRAKGDTDGWASWGTGLALGLGIGAFSIVGVCNVQQAIGNKWGPAALGDPLTVVVESALDIMRHVGPATPRQLIVDVELPATEIPIGAARAGWPASSQAPDGGCWPHPHARTLDFEREPPAKSPRGRQLLGALAKVSEGLFEGGDEKVAVFQLSLEGFRADDIHALNPKAPLEIAPFTSALYGKQSREGVLVSRTMYQAGVRTVHCLGAMACGLGTMPYNMSFIRDLHPFPVRCASDVLHDSGFEHAFFYGADATFDGMDVFFGEHGYTRILGQAQLPEGLPKGTWDGLTDFAVFDEATARTAKALAEGGPQFSFVMSLSHHSSFTPPEDLPAAVTERVDAAIKGSANRVDADDRKRLLTYSYTDAAYERLFAKLGELGIAERSVVIAMADHSTGHSYVWGAEADESDDAKARIPFAIVIPEAFMARVANRPALEAALAEAQALISAGPLSQNDVPAMLLALLSAHPRVKALAPEARWHTLGGQVTSPFFDPGGDPKSYLLGINGISELTAFDINAQRVGDYEDSVFIKTRADRYRVTPRLIPVAATLADVMKHPKQCP